VSSHACRNVSIALLVLISSLQPATLRAQTSPAIGSEVVLKAGASLRLGDQVVDAGKMHRIYQVKQTNGEWLWLVSGKVSGWARPVDVLPLDQALEVYTAEIKRNPHAAWPHFNRGLIYQDRRDTNKALNDYSEAIRQEPTFVPALINRGNIWLIKGSYDRAIVDFSDAIKIEPKDALAHYNRAVALQAKGDYAQALADYDEAIQGGVKTAAAFNNRGHARAMKKEYDGAIADYDEALRLDPGYALAWINRGSARESEGDYEGALKDYAEAIRLNPQSPLGYARRAWILATCPVERFRNGKEAIELATKACDLSGSKDASILDIRAAAHAEAGEFPNAVYWESRAAATVARATTNDVELYRRRLALYKEQKPYREGR
jgi:tetratricopeptide (TPR) repeat protein